MKITKRQLRKIIKEEILNEKTVCADNTFSSFILICFIGTFRGKHKPFKKDGDAKDGDVPTGCDYFTW